MKIRNLVASVLAALLIASATWVAAAPIKPATKLSSEIRSLRDLEEVEIKVQALSRVLDEVGLKSATVHGRMVEALADSGILPSEGTGGPVLRLVILTQTEPDYPEMVSFTYHLSLEQSVTVNRIDEQVHVPTYALVHGTLTTKDKLLPDLNRLLPIVMRHFLERVKMASRAS